MPRERMAVEPGEGAVAKAFKKPLRGVIACKNSAGRGASGKGKRASTPTPKKGRGDLKSKQFYKDTEGATNYLEGQAAGLKTTALERKSQDFYGGAGYRALNQALRSPSPVVGLYKKEVRGLDSLIGKSRTAREFTVYRGIELPEGFNPKRLVGKKLGDRAYASTSLQRHTAVLFAGGRYATNGLVIKMKLPKGTRAAHLSSMDEGELLLGRGSRVRIKSVRTTKKGITFATAEYVGTYRGAKK